MAISYVGGAMGTNSATLPAFQSGDCALVFAFRDGSTTNPTVPAGWTNLTNTQDGTTCSISVGWRRLVNSDTTTGTWTNASRVSVVIYRGCEPFIAPFVLKAATAGTTNTAVTMTTVSMTRSNGTSWIVGSIGHRSVDTDLGTAWTGMTNRQNAADATAETCQQDTNAGVSSWSSQSRNIGGTASGWVSQMVVLALPAQNPPETLASPMLPPLRMAA